VPGGPAEQAGLKGGDKEVKFQAGQYSTGGDVILEVDGHKVISPNDLARLVASKKPGEKVTLTILREGQQKQIEVTLGQRPDSVAGG
jgi:S1-C subfamily serine protease